MLNRVKSSAIKAQSKIKNSAMKVRGFFSQYRWRIFIIFLVLSLIALIAALVISAIRGVKIIDQAVIINYTESKII